MTATSPGSSRSSPLFGPAALLLLLAGLGCSRTGYVVIQEDLPVYVDADLGKVADRLHLYAYGEVDSAIRPGGDVVPIIYGYGGPPRTGFVRRAGLRLFDAPKDRSAFRFEASKTVVREARMSETWPEETLRVVEEGRVEIGMTKGMVLAAYGHPQGVTPLTGGRELWDYSHRVEERGVRRRLTFEDQTLSAIGD